MSATWRPRRRTGRCASGGWTRPGTRRVVHVASGIKVADGGLLSDDRLELSTKATILAPRSEVRRRVESKLRATFRESETRKRGFEVDGGKVRKVRVVWVDRYRAGTATLNVNGTEHVLPFRFP